jgi:uncharacterized protein (TIGR03118 family)
MMAVFRRIRRPVVMLAVGVSTIALAAPGTALADGRHGHNKHNNLRVEQINLVSDRSDVGASLVDPDLINPWGLALGPTTPLWSANNGTDTATLYTNAPGTSTAAKVGAVRVTFPDTPELPTGQVFNGTTGFLETPAADSSARFIFSTLTGRIEAWSPVVDPLQGNARTVATVPGAVYTGLAIANATNGPQLYAANFGQGTVDVFDTTFTRQPASMTRFHDRHLPAGYAPFGIQTLKNRVFVAYALVDPVTHRNAVGKGLGFVDEYTANGRLVGRVASRHTLNAPWGMVIAPASWGRLAGDLLVGNFGDGRISVIEAERHGRDGDRHGDGHGDRDRHFDGDFEGLLRDAHGHTLVIPGLWALLQGTATTGGTDSVFFSAGINDGHGGPIEEHGLIGVLRKA